MTQICNELATLLSESAKRPFVPFAYYDRHMDCIRIELRDCSTYERRLNEVLTFAYDNYPEPGQNPVAGITIKGVKHYFMQWGIPLEGIRFITDILNIIVTKIDLDAEEKNAIKLVNDVASTIELPVDLRLAA